jgi:hypothetical protein
MTKTNFIFAFTKMAGVMVLSLCMFSLAQAQNKKKKDKTKPTVTNTTLQTPAATPPKPGPRPYKEIITPRAKTTKGLFTIHKIEEKYYFEIPDSIIGREILAVTRIAKAPTNMGFGGEEINEQVLKWEKGPENKLFLKVALYLNVGTDTLQPIYKAVKNSNVEPIAAAFDIKSFRKDTSTVIEVTDFLKGDNQIISLQPTAKQLYRITAIQADRSYIQSVKSFPINTEIRTVKTYGVSPPPLSSPLLPPSPIPSVNLPAGIESGSITLEMNTSLVILPKVPAKKRLFDPRVGYFADGFTVYDDASQKTETETFVTRWKLEPKNAADAKLQQNGQLIEPKKPIIFYIDPATPTKWRKYLIMGVNDWQIAFEKAGWKNAIYAKEVPAGDSINVEDSRYSFIRYFAASIENAYGPNVHDPRSGEIIESHIGWYHNVMNLLRKWYFIQTAATDPKARKVKFDDELMGQLIRFVSSHEVGHTLGLRHNFGASHATPVAMLRNKAFTDKNGHTSSIMDYARFNYVAQPEDGVTDFFPRIGDYDIWAIEWAYKPVYDATTPQDEKKVLNKWYLDNVTKNERLLFLTETNAYDPRAQSEDIGDNAMIASEYGIKNLQRIVPNLITWTQQEAETYRNVSELYAEVTGQYRRYLGHVTKYVGGIYETPKTYDQTSPVYEPTPKNLQQDAVKFLNQQLFQTPTWLLNTEVLNKITPGQGVEAIRNIQDAVLNNLFETSRMQRLIESSALKTNTYSLDDLFTDVRKGIFNELVSHKPIDTFRRNLQKSFVEKMISIVNPAGPTVAISGFSFPNSVPSPTTDPKKSDIMSLARATLVVLQQEIRSGIPATADKMSLYHLQDLNARIQKALDPK